MEMEMDSDTIVLQTSGEDMVVNESLPENPFSCNVCKRSYTRVDHLARHYRSHSRERPFACKVCGKTFARVDLLKRHLTNHNSDDDRADSATVPATKRRRHTLDIHKPRAQKACKPCADAKAKCEDNRPCLRCRQKSIPCEYPPSRSDRSSERVEVSGAVPIPAARGEHLVANSSTLNQPHQTTEVPDMSRRPGPPRNNSTVQAQSMINQTANIQLPTPSTFGQDALPSDAFYEHDPMVTFDDVPVFDFLRDVQTTANQADNFQNMIDDEPFPRDVLDFGVDLTFNTPSILDADFQYLMDPNLLAPVIHSRHNELSANRSGTTTPGLRGKLNVSAGAQAFKESVWLWTPEKDDHGALEQRNLSLSRDNQPLRAQGSNETLAPDQVINANTRGRILAMVLRTCEPAIYSHVVSNFPSTQLLTKLLHDFLNFHSHQEISWIHPSNINVNTETSEFLASMIATGAAISQEPEIRKLGFAIQEAVRMANPLEFERDNRMTRELRPLQSYALYLDVGLWSGDRRKMEISESFAMPLVTMVRRASHFRRARNIEIPPQQEDSGDLLESKWHSWIQRESFKRLALYLFYRDTRSSMSLLSQPLISYAELTTALPCREDLWLAKTATEWKTVHLAQCQNNDTSPLPSIRSCMEDSSPILLGQDTIDINASLLLLIATVWPQLWQYREMRTVANSSRSPDSGHGSLVMNSRQHELVQFLERIRMNSQEWHVELKPAAWLLHEQCLMHLSVSLEDVQLLAGKEGEHEARRIFPTLSAWAESSGARQALFHAGQILRAAKEFDKFMLRDASAVAVYHASLVFWAYAVLSKRNQGHAIQRASSQVSDVTSPDLVRLDGERTQEVQRFLMLGRGIPCIEQQVRQDVDLSVDREVSLNEPAQVMSTIAILLQKPYGEGDRNCPPLIDNLCKLMHSLGKAAVARMLA